MAQWLLETGIKVSGKRDTLHLHLPVPLMLGNQMQPREAITLDFSFRISENISQLFWMGENNCPDSKGVKSQDLQTPSRAMNRNNTAASLLQDAILHDVGVAAVQQVHNRHVWSTLPWEVSYRNEIAVSTEELFPFAEVFVRKRGEGCSFTCGFYFVSILPAGSLRE